MTNETEPTGEERALFIGEKLGIKRYVFLPRAEINARMIVRNDSQWLSSPDGLDAVEQGMIERDYSIVIRHGRIFSTWECSFINEKSYKIFQSDEWTKSKPEAVLTAAYRALKTEETHG